MPGYRGAVLVEPRATTVREVLRRAVTGLRRDVDDYDIVLYSGALTFYAMISAVPLILVSLWVVGLALGEDAVRGLGNRLADTAPETLGFAGQLRSITRIGTGLGAASLVAALVAGTTYGEGFVRVFERLYRGVDRPRKALRGRLLSLLALAVFPLFVGGGLAVAASLTQFFEAGTGSALLGAFLAFCIGWVASTALVSMLYRLFAPVRHPWRPLLWGSAATASFITGMSEGWLLLLGLEVDLGRAYGGSAAVAGAAVFAAWLFLVHYTLVVGLLVTRRLSAAMA